MQVNLGKRAFGLILGPITFVLIMLFYHPVNMSTEAHAVMACTAWIAIWWITEALPIAVTSLLPIIIFPLSGGSSIKEAVTGYSHPFIFLFIGGFLIAIAMEKWKLHKRVALLIISWVGTSKRMIIWGFMLATAFLSMWISNTATTLMMLPIGMAIVERFRENDTRNFDQFGTALMLAIAYSASIGGMATLLGSPPNLIMVSIVEETYGFSISFMDWIIVALPLSIILLVITWLYLSRFSFRLIDGENTASRSSIQKQLQELGSMSYEEKGVSIVFVITAVLWITRSFVLEPLLPAIDDTIIALLAAVALFIIPSSLRGEKLLSWEDASQLPWGVLLLFGGGISVAAVFDSSGLAVWIGQKLEVFAGWPILAVLLGVVAVVNFLTEITSNTATTAVMVPLLAPLATVVGAHPLMLIAAATMAASCAFMLPVATPPNALVFSSGQVKMSEMIKTGIVLNIISILLIGLILYYLVPILWPLSSFSF